MQRDEANEFQKAFWNCPTSNDSPEFDDFWPTETRGNGILRANNLRTGAAQGKSSMVRKAPCQLCGFINDMNKIDHSGGSIDGMGAGGGITTQTASAPTSAPLASSQGIFNFIKANVSAVIQDLTYTVTNYYGPVIITYVNGAALNVSVLNGNITITFVSATTTASQIVTAYNLVTAATALATISVSGVGGNSQTAPATATVNNAYTSVAGYTHSENAGTQAYRNASGCALCFSKNSVSIRQDVSNYFDPWDRLRITGF